MGRQTGRRPRERNWERTRVRELAAFHRRDSRPDGPIFRLAPRVHGWHGLLPERLSAPLVWNRQPDAPHVWAAVASGAAVLGSRCFWQSPRSGRTHTRNVIAAAHILSAGLFIHLTCGRLEAPSKFWLSSPSVPVPRLAGGLLIRFGRDGERHLVRGARLGRVGVRMAVGTDWVGRARRGWLYGLVLAGVCCGLTRPGFAQSEREGWRPRMQHRGSGPASGPRNCC